MIVWALTFVGFVLLYISWSVSLSSWSRLAELGIENKRSSTSYFDNILTAGIIGTIISRVSWMLLNLSVYQDVPWGILPYSRTAAKVVWFTVFPWRVFRLAEGLFLPALWGFMGVAIVIWIFLPTIKLAMKLRLEKRGIMRSFIIKNAGVAMLTILYFASLTYLAW